MQASNKKVVKANILALCVLCFTVAPVVALFAMRILAPMANAYELTIVDQHGDPVKDAFVAIPEGAITNTNKAPAVMDQVDVQFVPHVLAVDEGQSVIFPNSDNIRHHVYSFSKPKRFEIKLYQGVPKQPIEFGNAGLVALGCNIHDSMLAYIFVSPWPDYMVTAEDGIARFQKVSRQFAVWHPWMKGQKEAKIIALDGLDDMSSQGTKATIVLDLVKPKVVKKFKNYRRRYND